MGKEKGKKNKGKQSENLIQSISFIFPTCWQSTGKDTELNKMWKVPVQEQPCISWGWWHSRSFVCHLRAGEAVMLQVQSWSSTAEAESCSWLSVVYDFW